MTTSLQVSRRDFIVGSAVAALGGLPLAARGEAATQPESGGKRPKAAGWQIGCYTRPWGAHEYTVALDAVAEAGFQYVGLMTSKSGLVLTAETPPEQAVRIHEEVAKRGLKVASIYGGEIPVQESLKAGIEGMHRLIDNCLAVKCPSLLMGGIGDEKYFEVYYKAIAECCPYAASKKLEITVKPHGGLNSTGPQCRKCVEQVDKTNFTIWYDPGNIFYYSDGKLDPVDDAATVDGLVSGMSVKDYEHPKKVDVTPGTGKVNFKAVLGRLKKGGFTGGPLVVECLTARDSLAGTLEEARKAKAFLERLVREV